MPFLWCWSLGTWVSAGCRGFRSPMKHGLTVADPVASVGSSTFSGDTFPPVSFASSDLCCKYYLFLRVPWQAGMWTVDSIIWPCRSWECVATGVSGGRKRKSGLAVTHGPLTSLWNASLLASEKQRSPVGPHLSKCCLAVGLEQQLPRERNSCQGREGSDTSSRRSVYLPVETSSHLPRWRWSITWDWLPDKHPLPLAGPRLAGSGGQEFGKKGSHSEFLLGVSSHPPPGKAPQTLKVTTCGLVSEH